MGVKLKDLVSLKVIDFNTLSGKYISIDALNAIYQFMAIIRQPDGTPLKDHNGNVTSHLSGLFYRTINFLEMGMKPVYVFDGRPPELKTATIEERIKIREAAREKWKEALKEGDLESARKYAQAAIKVDETVISESKTLIQALGIPVVQAPSEGEAQAAYMAKKGHTWASASQDYDSLLFGSPRLVRNLTLRRKRKVAGKSSFVEVDLELVELETVLRELGITQEQLVDIGILVGTDYNEGVKGIGPKKAYQLIKKYNSLEEIVKREKVNLDWELVEKIRNIFLNPDVTDDYQIEFKEPNSEKIVELLVEIHDFSEERVKKALERLDILKEKSKQTSLDQWFG
ncbi:MAG: flap endonuclease-1 [Candidatus Odinarchaeota archaeon]|nr:flap endonuclease-1 [Candidatus Odinarchaeota archaeon]